MGRATMVGATVLAVVLAMAGTAAATPTVSLVGTYNDSEWGVYLLSDSQGDNDGVVSIVFKVGNILTASNVSPTANSYVGDGTSNVAGVFGFNFMHSAQPVTTGVYEFISSVSPTQITQGSPYVLRHMGQQTVDYTITNQNGSTTARHIPASLAATLTVPTNTAGITPGNYPYSFKVAQGTMTSGTIPTVVPYNSGVTAGVSVLQAGGNSSTSSIASAVMIPAPEPATLALLAMGAGIALRRRRK